MLFSSILKTFRNRIVIDFFRNMIHSVRLLLTKTFKQTRSILEKNCKEILIGHES